MKTAIERIGEYQRFGSVLGLERMMELLSRLGDPHLDLQIIHVAGTNGKGSVCRYIYECLLAAGYKAGLYSSPYIEEFRERIQLDGEMISNQDLEEYTNRVIRASDAMVTDGLASPTEFEIITAIALLYFREKDADFVVLEVGLGGRGDSTNVSSTPLLTVITSISYDHMDRLGNTLEEIAWEKAGIIKEGVPLIIHVEEPAAAKVIAREAYAKGAILTDATRSKALRGIPSREGETFSVDIQGSRFENIRLSMIGEHQVDNGVTALTAIEILRKKSIINITVEDIRRGMKRAFQKGRFEILPGAFPIVLDGAHNREGMEALVKTMDELFYGKRVLTVMGVLGDKDVDAMVEMAAFLGEDYILTEPGNSRKMDSTLLASKLSRRGKNCQVIPDPKEAIAHAVNLGRREDQPFDVILCVGSLYLIGELRRWTCYERKKET